MWLGKGRGKDKSRGQGSRGGQYTRCHSGATGASHSDRLDSDRKIVVCHMCV